MNTAHHASPSPLKAVIQQGFTLIELMIVVAIVAILAAIALPSYQQYVIRGQAASATAMLASFGTAMQQYYQDNRSYVISGGAAVNGSNCGNGGPGGTGIAIVPSAPAGLNFTFACAAVAATAAVPTTFSATATGNANTPEAGLTFSLDQNGTRQTTAGGTPGWPTSTTAATANPCWVNNKSGTCF